MQQSQLWHDTIYDALGSTVQSCGGVKKTAARLWPSVNSATAEARLRAALSPEHAQKIDPQELLTLMHLGVSAGDHSIMQFIARDVGYEAKPITAAEVKAKTKRARIQSLLAEASRLAEEP